MEKKDKVLKVTDKTYNDVLEESLRTAQSMKTILERAIFEKYQDEAYQ